MKKYVKAENNQIVEISLEPRLDLTEFECEHSSSSIFLVNGEFVEGFYDPNEYTAEQIALFELQDQKNQAKEYLLTTDWYAVRFAETGKAIPEDVLIKRQEAREILSK